jgi:hypothetical protein
MSKLKSASKVASHLRLGQPGWPGAVIRWATTIKVSMALLWATARGARALLRQQVNAGQRR